jgi:hypothetical protein
MKSFERKLLKTGKELKDIADSLRRFMQTLLRMSNWTVEKKVEAWLNSINHYLGIHTKCPFEGHDTGTRWAKLDQETTNLLLRQFLEDTAPILQKCSREFSTQMNESLNRSKSKYGDKDVKWWWTWEARMACAVLDRNWPFWKVDLHGRLGLRARSAGVQLQIIARENQRLMTKARFGIDDENVKEKFIKRVRAARPRKQAVPMGEMGYKTNPYLRLFPEPLDSGNP